MATCNAIRGMLSVPFDVAHRLGFVPINPVSARGASQGQEREVGDASPSRPRNP